MNKKSILSSLILLMGATVLANNGNKGKKSETVNIKSSTVCGMCETAIESNLIYENGVQKVDVDLATSTVVVTYNPRKTDAAKLRTAITKLGYAADELPADTAAFAKLPGCCQKSGCGMPAHH
ncbi:MAG TPA: heavy metal-associated domain-containing protein [Flavobacteriales bacterium]|nr:heavy metal-associated domain-containing protein [Flavobacteriales bacterium]